MCMTYIYVSLDLCVYMYCDVCSVICVYICTVMYMYCDLCVYMYCDVCSVQSVYFYICTCVESD